MPSNERPHLESRKSGRRAFTASLLIASAALCGCQSYSPQALDAGLPQWTAVERLAVDPRALRLPGAAPSHPFDSSDGLDATEIEMLAVSNNPELRLARADLKLAQAQAFAAGLLPDPQLSLSAEHARPTAPGLVTAFNAGISFDLGSLMGLSSKRSAAQADAEKTDLALLWQEWQVASQARQLFIRQRALEQTRDATAGLLALQDQRYALARKALDAGNLAADAVGPYLVAREDTRKQLADAERQLSQTRHDLAALLGLAPDTLLDLSGPADAPPIDDAAVSRRLQRLARYRPDLLALEAGYASQEDKLRAAVLAQFPAITIGPTRLRDNTGIYSTGFAAGISLPIFSRNRGNIAIEGATRARLRQEYDNRLRAAYADVDRLLADERLLEAQWHAAQKALPELERTANQGRAALAEKRITISSYVDLESAAAAKRIELIGLEQSVWTQRLALAAVLGDSVTTEPTSIAGTQ